MKCKVGINTKVEVNTIEKIAKAVVLIPAILMLSIFLFALFSELSGKSVSIGGDYRVLGFLIDIGILMLIYVSVHEFIRTYREAVQKNK